MRKLWPMLLVVFLISGCTVKVCGDAETQLQTGDGHMLETLVNDQKAEAEVDAKAAGG